MGVVTFMEDGGLFGGQVPTVWYSPRQPSSTKSICLFTYEMPRSIREYVTKNRFISLIHSDILYFRFSCFMSLWFCFLLVLLKFPSKFWDKCIRNCEDIAMSLLVANATSASLLPMQPMLPQYGWKVTIYPNLHSHWLFIAFGSKFSSWLLNIVIRN